LFSRSPLGTGVINFFGTVTLTNCTVSGNAASNGGGVAADGASVVITLTNTIVAGQTAGGNFSGTVSGSNNLIDTQGSGGLIDGVDGNIVGVASPGLAPLADNGGPTQTMALLPGSPALNAGDPDQLGTADQRGVVRTGGVNIGAYQASAASFRLDAPASVTAGVPFDVTVSAYDVYGQPAVGYTGTAHFTSTDNGSGVVLPADYTFTPGDGGVHTFTDTGLGETTLVTPGDQTLTVTDRADGTIAGSATVTVGSTGPGAGGRLLGHSGRSTAPINAPSGSARPGPEGANADRYFAALLPEGAGSLWSPKHARGDETGPWGLERPGELDLSAV
jgi:hypothetical protein